MALTALSVKNAKPGDKPRKIYDGQGGLYLLVHPSGAKYWRVKYRHSGREKTLALGVWPDVSLSDARDKCAEARRTIRDGVDPVAERRRLEEEQARQERADALAMVSTFEAVAREWLTKQGGRWIPSHAASVQVSLERDAFPLLGARPIADITPPELLAVVRAVEHRGSLDIASRVLQRCSAVFRYGVQTGRLASNPARDLSGVIQTRPVTHRAAPARGDLPELLKKIHTYDGEPLTRLGLFLALLTFVRSGEIRGARWCEFDLDNSIWRIPAERMKMKREHLVPLSRQAVATLRAVHELTGRFDLVFPNVNNPLSPMSENTLLFALYRLGYHGRMTQHGFRAAAATYLSEEGFPPEAIERQLAHHERNKVKAAYQRSEHLAERRRMMQTWADFLDAQTQEQRPALAAIGG